jgi:centrosomal CEP192-like protein
MISRALLAAALLPLSALAQLQLFIFDGSSETPVGALANVGTASPGDSVVTRFRVRNTGTGPTTLQTLSLAGTGFSFSAVPSLPYILAPYTGSAVSEVEFDVTFSPTGVASYSAFLLVNAINVILQGTGTPSAILTLAGSNIPFASGAIIDFGSVASGSTKLLTFNLSNTSTSPETVTVLSVTGSGFKGPIGATAPLSLAPGQTVSFQIEFLPTSGQASQATLALDQRTFTLTGQGLSPPLPLASIVFGSSVGLSIQQNNVSIPLAAASQVSATGTLTMTFQSSVPGVTDDPAIEFLSGPLRVATVSISPGDTTAMFDGGQSDLAFQTGATAGAISFALTLNGSTTPAAEASLTIAPAAVNVQTVTAIHLLGPVNVEGVVGGVDTGGEVDVSIAAADNTYSASQLAFTFFDKNGATISPGVIDVNTASDFQSYFATTQTGGAFALLAKFPVTGDVTQIISAVVAITNTVGTTTTQQILIGN